MLVETLINNPMKKFNHEDLLDDIPKDDCLYKALPKLPDFHLKSSSLDTSYKTYDPRIMDVMQRSKKIEALTNIRKNARTPSMPSRTIKIRSRKEENKSFSISYKKKNILRSLNDSGKAQALPNINTRLKEFIGKVQEKYAKLVKALEFKQDILSFDAIIGYLKKSSILLKRPTYTRDRQRAYSKSPPVYRNNQYIVPIYQEDITMGISEKMLLLSDILDPFKTGIISKQHFYGILTMYEYTNFGMPKNLSSSRLDFNNLRHLQSLSTQVNEIKRIYKHYSDCQLLTRDGFTCLLRSIFNSECTEEILFFLTIGNKVNFAQFLSVIPLLLENYDNLMVKIQV
ncbi:hypothetical protein SteCoe_29932 [Stentor coeruleus]|uniref:EF-hand domain-containing protein n=1 Tax=Stentor coeruleus TaxID=5963 RepID=A0A1R2B4P0_9CILI|nr:hypothetical protein SteCoe_29932 [Stentor coeruleus]